MSAPARRRLTGDQMHTILTAIRAVDDPAALLPTVLAYLHDALLRHDGRRLADLKDQRINPDDWQIPATQWDTIAEAVRERADVWGTSGHLRAALLDRMPGCFDDPTAAAGHPPDTVAAEPGWRLLYVSVRGHTYLAGNPTVHPVDTAPTGVGTRFADLNAITRHVRTELRGLSAYWQVRVIDDAGTVVMYGFRTGPGGTGERWTWRPAQPAGHAPAGTPETST